MCVLFPLCLIMLLVYILKIIAQIFLGKNPRPEFISEFHQIRGKMNTNLCFHRIIYTMHILKWVGEGINL